MSNSVNRKFRRGQAARAQESGALPDLAELAGPMVMKALKVLERIIDDETATQATRLRAIGMLLDRVYGRPRPASKAPPAVQAPRQLVVVPPPAMTQEEWYEKYGIVDRSAQAASPGD